MHFKELNTFLSEGMEELIVECKNYGYRCFVLDEMHPTTRLKAFWVSDGFNILHLAIMEHGSSFEQMFGLEYEVKWRGCSTLAVYEPKKNVDVTLEYVTSFMCKPYEVILKNREIPKEKIELYQDVEEWKKEQEHEWNDGCYCHPYHFVEL